MKIELFIIVLLLVIIAGMYYYIISNTKSSGPSSEPASEPASGPASGRSSGPSSGPASGPSSGPSSGPASGTIAPSPPGIFTIRGLGAGGFEITWNSQQYTQFKYYINGNEVRRCDQGRIYPCVTHCNEGEEIFRFECGANLFGSNHIRIWDFTYGPNTNQSTFSIKALDESGHWIPYGNSVNIGGNYRWD